MRTTEVLTVHDLVKETPENGWCPRGNHRTYFYEVHRVAIRSGDRTTETRVMACTCGYVMVRPGEGW
jgi:hypothetical protein